MLVLRIFTGSAGDRQKCNRQDAGAGRAEPLPVFRVLVQPGLFLFNVLGIALWPWHPSGSLVKPHKQLNGKLLFALPRRNGNTEENGARRCSAKRYPALVLQRVQQDKHLKHMLSFGGSGAGEGLNPAPQGAPTVPRAAGAGACCRPGAGGITHRCLLKPGRALTLFSTTPQDGAHRSAHASAEKHLETVKVAAG